jgi:hypothetical protein
MEVEHLDFCYGKIRALKDVSLRIPKLAVIDRNVAVEAEYKGCLASEQVAIWAAPETTTRALNLLTLSTALEQACGHALEGTRVL